MSARQKVSKPREMFAPYEAPRETPKPFTAIIEITPHHVIGRCVNEGCRFTVSRPHRKTDFDIRRTQADLQDHVTLHRSNHKDRLRVEMRFLSGAAIK